MMRVKFWKLFSLAILILVFVLFLIRLILPSQLDDVNPLIPCGDELLDKTDVYYVIPKFGNVSINKAWCDEILTRDKIVRMHGVYHTFDEFGVARSENYFQEGFDIFEECFEFQPTSFKPPQIAWTDENNWMKDKIDVDLNWNQVFHKVYHCNDSGAIPNWIVRIF